MPLRGVALHVLSFLLLDQTQMSRSLASAVLALLLALGLAVGMTVYFIQPASKPAFKSTDISGVGWGRDFDLVDHMGKRRALADFRGKVVMVFFGYSNCPDVCPTALADMAQVVQRLGTDGERVQALFITTDPARDTAERLAAYVTAFHLSFLGLRGTPEQITQLAKEFKVYYLAEKPTTDAHAHHDEKAQQYMVQHTSGIFVFDPDGRLRLYVGAADRSVDDMVNDVKLLLGDG